MVHLTTHDEIIITTVDHPFYVKSHGFVNAGELQVGDEVLSAKGETYPVGNIRLEFVEEPERVYNFQVEDYHIYHVGNVGVLVHNANADYEGKGTGRIPVEDKTTATNGLDYQSNPKHTPGQNGNRSNAGIEPSNSLDLFAESVPATKIQIKDLHLIMSPIHCIVFIMMEMVLGIGVVPQIKVQILYQEDKFQMILKTCLGYLRKGGKYDNRRSI